MYLTSKIPKNEEDIKLQEYPNNIYVQQDKYPKIMKCNIKKFTNIPKLKYKFNEVKYPK